MIITTGELIGFKIKDYIGVVFGVSIRASGYIKDSIGKIVDTLGGEHKSYADDLEKAIQEAFEKMLNNAAGQMADAVYGIESSISTLSTTKGGFFIVVIYGTAVRGEKI